MSDENKKPETDLASRPAKKERIQVNQIDDKGKASLKSRIIVSVVLIAIFVPCMVLGSWYWLGVISVVLAIAIHEFIKAPQKKYRWYIYVFTYLLVASFVYWALVKNNVIKYNSLVEADKANFTPKLEDYFANLSVSLYGVALGLGFYFFVAIIHDDFNLNDVCYLFMMSILIGIGFQSFFFIRYYPTYLFQLTGRSDTSTNVFKYWQSVELIFFVFGITIFNDVWAYFVGVFFGKHHMNPRISPKKTWEGFFGGWILSSIMGIAFGLIVDSLGSPILPTLDMNHWYWVVLLSLAIPAFGDLGDFSFSLIKRHFGFKDYGTIFKAHGGVLDRTDSLIFASIATSIILIFMQGNWNFFLS